ncbi:periplasmic substrate-binding protein [Sorangium cellulosum]|uniref:Periplasmic substrate-binding protein n=1 Tax=Sorangium cellulosum TaxID=56 RepID=A0A4P2QBL1_SORCE|nr:helical backbone metal receptor [Sorangium cellulosum]AUX27087.1 periplasmic substrate-binding protein [Sorangium cellulosum]
MPDARGPRLRRRAALAALAALGLSACGREAPAAAGAARVVSLSPSTTEAAFAIGAGAALVGRSRYCDHPPEALRLPSVGGYADPSIEAIIALSPTLVIGSRGPAGSALDEALRGHGIATYLPETESLAQIEAMLAEIGRRLGAAQGAARAIDRIRARRLAIEQAVKARPRVRVALLFDTSPLFVAGPGSFADELIRLAGGENVITRGGPYPSIGVEHLLALDPDVLLDGTAGEGDAHGAARLSTLREAPGFRSLRAVREGRVRPLRTDVALRPGPRIGDGLAAVALAVHGDALALAEPAAAPLPRGGGAGREPPSPLAPPPAEAP